MLSPCYVAFTWLSSEYFFCLFKTVFLYVHTKFVYSILEIKIQCTTIQKREALNYTFSFAGILCVNGSPEFFVAACWYQSFTCGSKGNTCTVTVNGYASTFHC